MLDEIFALFAILVILGVGFVRRPDHASCSIGDFVNGVRPNGSTWCIRAPRFELDCSGTKRCVDTEPIRYTTPLKIYCTGGSHAIVINERTVGCQM